MEQPIGRQVPYFSMEALSTDGERFVCTALPDCVGKRLVLLFYPMDFTFVYPTKFTAFLKHQETFRTVGIKLLSVNTDSVYTHQAWQHDSPGGLGYPMAVDQALRACADYGVLLEGEGVALHKLFLVDPEQEVRHSIIRGNNIGRSSEEVLRILAALKTGGLYVTSWETGEENLRPGVSECGAPVLAGTAPVRICTIPGCSYCRSIKESLRQGRISYGEISLAEDRARQASMESCGYTGLPATAIGAGGIIGYDMPRIRTALGLSRADEVK